MTIYHDSGTLFLQRERYDSKDLYSEAAPLLNLKGGTLSVDDSILDKPYSQYLAFVDYFWSGKHHRTVKSINLITLYYIYVLGQHLPVNFRVYDKSEGNPKKTYFQDLLNEVLAFGLEPALVTGDSGYSSVNNLKGIRNYLCPRGYQLSWLFALESNRRVALSKYQWVQVHTLDILPDDGLVVWLREFDHVKLLRTWLKDQPRHYAVFLSEEEQLVTFDQKTFTVQHDKHRPIEQYYRAIKQVCNIERFQVRSKTAIKNHLFAAIFGYDQLQKLSAIALINNCYSVQRNLFNEVVAAFIGTVMPPMAHLHPEFQSVVNA